MDASRFTHSIKGILDSIPFDRPELRNHFTIETENLKDIPDFVRRFFNISFIYSDNSKFNAGCILQRFVSPKGTIIYTVIIIIKKSFETDFQKQEMISNFLSRDYSLVCERRKLYCHEVCHLSAFINAFPSHQDYADKESLLRKIFQKVAKGEGEDLKRREEMFIHKLTGSFNDNWDKRKTMITKFSLSFEGFNDDPAEFDRSHFPYKGDELNYFKLFSELMATDKKLKKHIEKIHEYIRNKKIEVINGFINLERSFCDILHVELSYILKKAPEKRDVIIQEIKRRGI